MGAVGWTPHNLSLAITIGGAVVIIIFGPLLSSRREKRRLEELDSWAAVRGWATESLGSQTETGRRLQEHLLAVLPKGDMRRGSVEALWTGVYGWRPTTLADYYFSVATGLEYAGCVTQRFTIVVVQMLNRYPPVRIMTGELAPVQRDSERLPTLIPELYRRFRVIVEDPAVAGRLLEASIYDLLADKDFCLLDLRDQDLLLIWRRRSVSVANQEALLGATDSIAKLIERAVSG